MKTMSVTEVARNFSAVVNDIEFNGEEVILVRNNRQVGRIIPEAPCQNALEVFGDLYRTLDDDIAEEILNNIKAVKQEQIEQGTGTLNELRNVWAS